MSQKLDIETLEHLAERSKDRIDKQLDALDSLHSKTSTIISIAAIAFTLLITLADIESLSPIMKALIMVGCVALPFVFYLLFKILSTVKLTIGLGLNEYDKTAQLSYEKALLEEIGANRRAFQDNEKILKRRYLTFNRASRALMLIGMYFITFLMISIYNKQETEQEKIQKVEIVNLNHSTMKNYDPKGNENQSDNQEESQSPIPDVQPERLDNLEKSEDYDSLSND